LFRAAGCATRGQIRERRVPLAANRLDLGLRRDGNALFPIMVLEAQHKYLSRQVFRSPTQACESRFHHAS
jgi:hypothetical protein